MQTRWKWALAPALLVALWMAAPAQAEGDSEQHQAAKALLTEIGAALKQPDRSGLAEALARLPDAHNGLTDAALRKQLQKAAGKALKDKKGGESRRSAATALGRLDDPDGAYKELSKVLPAPKDKEATPTQLEALRATGALAPEAAVAALLKLLKKGQSLVVVEQAALALGGFGKSKKREAILRELLVTLSQRSEAAAAASKRPKKKPAQVAAEAAWKRLEAPLVEACNLISGQNHTSGQEWLDAYTAKKKALAGLFADKTD